MRQAPALAGAALLALASPAAAFSSPAPFLGLELRRQCRVPPPVQPGLQEEPPCRSCRCKALRSYRGQGHGHGDEDARVSRLRWSIRKTLATVALAWALRVGRPVPCDAAGLGTSPTTSETGNKNQDGLGGVGAKGMPVIAKAEHRRPWQGYGIRSLGMPAGTKTTDRKRVYVTNEGEPTIVRDLDLLTVAEVMGSVAPFLMLMVAADRIKMRGATGPPGLAFTAIQMGVFCERTKGQTTILDFLASLAQHADLSTRAGLGEAVSEVCLTLIRSEKDWVGVKGGLQTFHMPDNSWSDLMTVFNTQVLRERVKWEKETITNEHVPGQTEMSIPTSREDASPTFATVSIYVAWSKLKVPRKKAWRTDAIIDRESATSFLEYLAVSASEGQGANIGMPY
ncbi:unnamed protein product [Chrysoparadoxa australica]